MLLHNIGAAAYFPLFRHAKSTAQREVDPLRGAFLRYLVWERRNHVVPEKRISAKVVCIRESFMNPDVSYSGAFMLSTMLIFFTCRRMTKQTASVNSMVSATLSR